MATETYDFGSTNLDSASYDEETQTLTINFYSGGTFEYYNVPQGIWSGLKSAGSAGQYFHRVIKPRFAYQQV